jgi:hypothetical protein
MLDAIRRWNKSAYKQSPTRPEIRIIVSNACDSEDHVCVLSEGVDFPIDHFDPIAVESAIDFSGILFDCLFGCDSVMDNFNQAKSCCKGYQLFPPERDPSQFYSVPPVMRLGKRSTSSNHDVGEVSSSGVKRQNKVSPSQTSQRNRSRFRVRVSLRGANDWERQVQTHNMMMVRACPVCGEKKLCLLRVEAGRDTSINCMLKGVINKNFGVLLDTAQLLCVVDQLKTFDENVKCTKEAEMKEIIDDVIAGSISSSSETPDRTVLESLQKAAGDTTRDLSKLSDGPSLKIGW